MDEDFKDVTASSKKVGVIFILVIIGLLVGGYFVVFKPIHFTLKTVELELGSDIPTDLNVYLGSYGGSIDKYKLNTSGVDKDTVGEYTYTISSETSTKKGKIKVLDTKPPKFTLKEMVIEEGNTDYFLGEFLETCEDSSMPCLVSLKNSADEKKFGTPGTYEIDLDIADVYGNKESAKGTLKVVPKGEYTDERTLDLEYSSNSKGTEKFTGTIFKKLDKAIDALSDQARDEMSIIGAIDLNTYVKENHPGYSLISSEIVELYNKSHFIIAYAIELKITNGKETTVYVDSTKSKNLGSLAGTEEESE